jgi:hypothetical protein
MEIDIKVEGLREIEEKLLKLDSATAVNSLNSALMSASLPAWKRAQANLAKYPHFQKRLKRKKHRVIKRKTGKIDIRKGFRRQATADRVTGVSIVMEWARSKEGKKGTEHYHLLELGTAERKTKKGKKRGAVKAQYYIKRAFDGKEQEAINVFSKSMRTRIKKLTKSGAL